MERGVTLPTATVSCHRYRHNNHMEKTMNKKNMMLLALCMAATTGWAQEDDFGLWGEVNVEKKINSRWSAGAGVEFRSRDNAGEADRWSVGADVTYKITDWLKASAGYTLLDDHRHKVNNSGKKYADYWGLRHRFNLSLTGAYSIGDLSISLRERWQYTYRPAKTVQRYWNYTDDDDDIYYGDPVPDKAGTDPHTYGIKVKNVWRNRLQLKYKLNKTWRPYASVETNVSHGLEKIRYAAGTEIRLSKKHWLDAKYLFQTCPNDDDDEGNRHIISLGYTYKF